MNNKGIVPLILLAILAGTAAVSFIAGVILSHPREVEMQTWDGYHVHKHK